MRVAYVVAEGDNDLRRGAAVPFVCKVTDGGGNSGTIEGTHYINGAPEHDADGI